MKQYLIKYNENYFIAKYNEEQQVFITFAEDYAISDVKIIGSLEQIERELI